MIGKMYNIDRDLANQEFNMYDQRVDSLGSLYNASLTGLNTQLDQQNNRNTVLQNQKNNQFDLINLEIDKIERKKNLAGTNFDISKSLADIENSGLTTQLQTLLSGIEANQSQTNANRNFNLEALTQRLKNLGLEYDVQGNIRLLADQEGDEARTDLVDLYTGGKSDEFIYATLEEMAKQRGETLSPWIIEAFGR